MFATLPSNNSDLLPRLTARSAELNIMSKYVYIELFNQKSRFELHLKRAIVSSAITM